MVLPMSLLRTAQNQPMMVELKNGETYSGVLASCDGFMNLHMRDIVCTSRDGERFWKIPECYVRGNSIKYLRLPDEVIDMVKDEPQSRKEIRQQFKARGRGRGGKGEGRGRGRGGQSAGPGEKRAGGGGDKAGKKARG
ncbi:Probable U6 snRNA-associated Sm-like protein LSm4 (Glycine-rich protein 10) (GRP 10) [Durusdinium trenchii]|uniref:U6 snRNA-associated Sm-like protein LSm4 n=1 Tax=Durusdinium trenchii TaxID=1381693 RepID=A0ABP0NQX5_9DINO